MKPAMTVLGTIVGILCVSMLHVSAAGLNPMTGEQPLNPLFIIIPIVAVVLGAVSYTHLDVYKRQFGGKPARGYGEYHT